MFWIPPYDMELVALEKAIQALFAGQPNARNGIPALIVLRKALRRIPVRTLAEISIILEVLAVRTYLLRCFAFILKQRLQNESMILIGRIEQRPGAFLVKINGVESEY